MSYKDQEFYQDAEPTPRAIGDRWITSDGLIKTCYNLSPALWVASSYKANVPRVDKVAQSGILFSAFTDGGAAAGTFTMAGVVPFGAYLLGSKVLCVAGFAGDTSAALIIGDGSDTDRFNTGTPSVFATAATGVQMGIPSGNKFIATAVSPILTVTSAADFTAVSAGNLTVEIYYIATV